jgi:uncharacterized heparinase superfamily protein
MTVPGAARLGATKDKLAWFASLATELRPALRARHTLPSGFGQKIVPFATGDADLASTMYAGRFIFAGQTISASPSDIFKQNAAKSEWQKAMAELDWLAHFNASDRNLHDQYAMRLLHYWSMIKRPIGDLARQTKTLIALATHGQMIARRCENSVQIHYFEIVGQELHNLVKLRARNSEQSIAKAMALLYCLNSFQGLGHFAETAFELIEKDLSHVILEDGGHISRQAERLIDFLELVIPLHTLKSPVMPPSLTRALENGLAMLKLLQCPDGKLSGLLWSDMDHRHLNRLLERQSVEIPKIDFARASGFARIAYEKTVLIADTSMKLGLEVFDGKQKLIQTQNAESGKMKPAIMQNAPQGTVLMMQSASQKRTCFLSANGHDLRIEDEFAIGANAEISIEIAPNIKLSSLMEGQAVMLVLPDQSVWHLKQRGATVHICQPNMKSEILIRRDENTADNKINWSLKKQAKAGKSPRKKPGFEMGLLI